MASIADYVNYYGVRSAQVSTGYAGAKWDYTGILGGVEVRTSYQSSSPRNPDWLDYETIEEPTQ